AGHLPPVRAALARTLAELDADSPSACSRLTGTVALLPVDRQWTRINSFRGALTAHASKPNGDDPMMQRRLNPFTVAPDGVAALVGVENYLQACGLDRKLIALVKTRVSQINCCAYCIHMHTEEARKLGESEVRL